MGGLLRWTLRTPCWIILGMAAPIGHTCPIIIKRQSRTCSTAQTSGWINHKKTCKKINSQYSIGACSWHLSRTLSWMLVQVAASWIHLLNQTRSAMSRCKHPRWRSKRFTLLSKIIFWTFNPVTPSNKWCAASRPSEPQWTKWVGTKYLLPLPWTTIIITFRITSQWDSSTSSALACKTTER